MASGSVPPLLTRWKCSLARLGSPLWITASLATLYVIAGRLGLSFAVVNPSTTPLWPPSGIALAGLLLFGYRMWPGVLIGAFIVNLPINRAPIAAFLIAAGNTLEAVLGAYLVRRFARGDRALERPGDIFAFAVLAGLCTPAVNAMIGATTLWLGGYARGPDYGTIWVTWWIGDGAGVLLFTPVLLLWAKDWSLGALRHRVIEAVGLLLSVILWGYFVFGPVLPPRYPLTFTGLPILLWAAFRFNAREVALAVMVLMTMAISGTLQGFGPFAVRGHSESLLLLHTFLATVSMTILSVAALVAERRRIAEEREVLREIGERERAHLEAANQAQSRLGAIVSGSDDAIISKTLDGTITSWNPAAERMFGYTAGEAIGRSIMLIIPPERLAEEDEVLARIRRGDAVDHFETVRARNDGTRLEVSLTISPVRNERGVIVGASKIARDISARKRHERERIELLAREQTARSEAEAANRAKDDFLATLSHELRTPLSAILGWAQVMRARDDPATTAQAWESIERNARGQAQLIEDLLDLSRIVAGKVRLESGPVDLEPVIFAAVETIRPAADAKAIRVSMHVDLGTNMIMGDPDRLQQIFWNLLSNAVKFTPSQGQVAVRVERTDSHLWIRVSDTGQGIKPEILPYIFERFRQADSSLARTQGGLGLGLAIVRHLVELQGGTVSAESLGEGQGATFTIKFPLASVLVDRRAAQVLSIRHPYEGPPCDGATILVVDDEQDARVLLTVILEDRGAEVMTASTVHEALEIFERCRFDAVVSDLAMPEEDGFALARHIRARPADRGGRVPLVALTAHAGAHMRVQALTAGFDAYVAKPVEPAELAAVVGQLLKRGRSA